ncbi:hypothetical protein AMJ83_09095 [candidate division WOR_3 bacterium SM23_42]|uniref:Fibronectin type-III domain-containing protein n=1 Tax=candidate division WOR_3 bacterium SM23_42 TaxID=1703779 RepID=A0A0S8FQE3_UNCW3|nr:MAG: hypothetical protein AMJ83_09095 [candidate division WOR_3 bacterium SM23_42]
MENDYSDKNIRLQRCRKIGNNKDMRITVILSFIVLMLTTCSPENIGAIGTPVLVSPINGSTITQNPPTLTWQGVATALAYDLMLADDSSFDYSGIVIDIQCHTGTEYTPTNTLGAGTYFWRVRALEGG